MLGPSIIGLTTYETFRARKSKVRIALRAKNDPHCVRGGNDSCCGDIEDWYLEEVFDRILKNIAATSDKNTKTVLRRDH
ncbi:hypothetical protein BGZ83_008312 [Gryganskiella cystojenkinii]|nr:hypothetical protein BGZ83_008312 [Gryganskiella cystojenkinii]